MMQKPESIEALRASKRVMLSEFEYQLLNSVERRGSEYSELFVNTPVGRGIGRLVVDRYSQLLYTTNADELSRIEAVKRARGGTTLDAIAWLVEQETPAAVQVAPAAPAGSKAGPSESQPVQTA
jgi:conjugal transfer ATP-binding protein TraC